MNTTEKFELIDEMISELDRSRITKQVQMAYISDICEKSNNILLQVETSQKAKAAKGDSLATRSRYCKETLHALAKIVEMFERLVNRRHPPQQSSGDFETYITSTKGSIDFLGSAVRKLLALNDTVNQIKSELHADCDEFDLDTSDSCDANSSE